MRAMHTLRSLRSLTFIVAVAAACSCGKSTPAPPDAQPGCNPIVGDDCLTPYPAFFYETTDATTMTGVRVSISDTALPVQSNGKALSPSRLNEKDGFSPATPFIVYLKSGVDPTQLDTLDTIGNTVSATSPYQIIEYATGDRVPVLAELDANADPASGDRQGLIIHPMTRLKPATRYIIALVGVRDAKGLPLLPVPFAALRDKTTLSKSLAPWKAHYEEIFTALQSAKVARNTVSLAWDVVTASDQTATSHLLKMRDEALAEIPPPMGSPEPSATPSPLASPSATAAYSILSITDTPSDPNLFREINATVKVPSYLADDSGKSQLNFDGNGDPQMRAMIDVPILIHIPQCARTATGPIPTVVFGHGLFSSAQEEMDSSTLEQVGNEFCVVFVGTDWWGLSSGDIKNVMSVLSTDLNGVYVITDRLQQAHVNAAVMTRTFLTQIKNDPALDVGAGQQVVDGSQVYYFGISLGGIEGTTFMGLNEDIIRGVLNVPGCEWSLLIFRSTDFDALHPLLTILLPDLLDQQVAIMSTQSEWDYTDAATYAPHLLQDPLPSTPIKRILVQESEGDAQVTNVATRVLARTMGLPGLDLEHDIYGVTDMSAPLDSAYTQWDSMPATLPPTGDQSLAMDNGAHDAVYPNPLAQQQIKAFLTPTGQVTSVCHGPCLFHQQ